VETTSGSLPYRIVETIPAGKVPEMPITEVPTTALDSDSSITEKTCSRIMTGAMLPPGADGVVMVEDSELLPEERVRFLNAKSGKNVCYKGEDIEKGTLVLHRGERIGAAQIAVLAAMGALQPLVSRLPRVAVISTGDELVEPHEKPRGAQIRNSNGMQLMAQLAQIPAIATYGGIARDTESSIRQLLHTALTENDVVLLSGGVSMGDYDFVPAVMQELGVDIHFKSVAIQPGRPTIFGKKGDKALFGLPGNPVSSFILFELMVKPYLFRMMGHNHRHTELTLPMGKDYSRRKAERRSLVPVTIVNNEIHTIDYHGSAHINAYTAAEAVLIVETGVTGIKRGEPANVRLL
jgi:molybdopterin molybdotransferase